MSTVGVLKEVRDERRRQDKQWGVIQTIPFGNGWTLGAAMSLGRMRLMNDTPGQATFVSVLGEEYFEAITENDLDRFREELIQVAAVAVKTIEHIDREKGVV